MTAVANILTEARDLLASGAWNQDGFFATDKYGSYIYAKHPDACKFCALGAIRCVSPTSSLESSARQALYRGFRRLYARGNLIYFNDCLAERVEDITAIYDAAIAAESELSRAAA